MNYLIKTIDVNGKEWFDKINGNSYFAAIITLNFGMPDQKELKLPFQYGYGNQYTHEALSELKHLGYISKDEGSLWQYCRNENIILRASMKENCLKKELKNI